MTVVGFDLISISGAAAAAAPLLLICIAVSWFANPQSLERPLTLSRPKPLPGAAGWGRALGGSLGLWAVACGVAIVVLHDATSDVGPRVGAYRTGIATLFLFALAAVIGMRRRVAKALRSSFVYGAIQHKLQQNHISHNFPHTSSTSWSIKPKTWQRMHIAVAIGAMLPFWWHCDLRSASTADLVLRSAAILLLTSGSLGIAITDLTRWRVISPIFYPGLSARLIKGFFAVHRVLALLTFTLITIHVLVVLYFAGV